MKNKERIKNQLQIQKVIIDELIGKLKYISLDIANDLKSDHESWEVVIKNQRIYSEAVGLLDYMDCD